jgi:putative addiction module antidote
MHTIKVTTIGESIGIVLPPEVLQHLHISDGDEVQFSETARGIELTSSNGDFTHQLEVAKRVMMEDREVLRKLAE